LLPAAADQIHAYEVLHEAQEPEKKGISKLTQKPISEQVHDPFFYLNKQKDNS